jgi:hypothetical protein
MIDAAGRNDRSAYKKKKKTWNLPIFNMVSIPDAEKPTP